MCTRTLFKADDGRVVTGRNEDWTEDMGTNLWAFAAGMARQGENEKNGTPFEWVSKYSTVIVCEYDGATADGMNSAGLVGNMLYLTEAEYGENPGGKKILSVAAWVQYLLDCCENVAEAVAVMDRGDDLPFAITTTEGPSGKTASQHVAMSDSTGDSAIFEFVDGKPRVYHARKDGVEYPVMTNSPSYDQQLAGYASWKEDTAAIIARGDTLLLPGGSTGADRFIRASYYLENVFTNVNAREAAAVVLGVQRNASTPAVKPAPDHPEQSHTLWTTVSDSTDRRYYFQDCLSPNIIWVDLNQFNFGESKSWKLNLKGHPIGRQGEMSAESGQFEPAEPFPFLYPGDPRLPKPDGTG